MKKIFTLLAIAITIISTAQESTLLRLNYKTGDQYIVSMSMIQGEMMAMDIEMSMDVKEVKDTISSLEMGIKRIQMDVNQGGIQMMYDSDLSDEDLDEAGKMIQTQFAPMLTVKIFSKVTHRAESFESKTEPNLPGMEQFTNSSSSVVYPKKAVKVGDSWTAEKTENGMKMEFIYTVKSIEKTVVKVDISGNISLSAQGTITGAMEIDKASGNVNSTIMDMNMNASGQEMKMVIEVVSKKI